MNPLTTLLATEHLLDLQREADELRLVQAARASLAGDRPWARPIGRSARGLSIAFGWIADRVDPADASRGDDRRTRPAAA